MEIRIYVAEVIDTFETELQFKPTPNFVGRTSVYYSSVTDKIDKASGLQPEKPLLGTDYYDNTKGTEVYGGEFLLRWRPQHFLIEGNYSYIMATDRNTERTQFGFPPHMGHAILGYNKNGFSLRLRGDFYSKRPREEWSPDAGLEDGDAFSLMQIAFLHENEGQQIKFAIQNLLDTEHYFYSILMMPML